MRAFRNFFVLVQPRQMFQLKGLILNDPQDRITPLRFPNKFPDAGPAGSNLFMGWDRRCRLCALPQKLSFPSIGTNPLYFLRILFCTFLG